MSRKKECGRSRCPVWATVGRLAVMLVVLMVAACATMGPEPRIKDTDQGVTQIFRHTYDEVFQASEEAIERQGWFLDATDKEKGTISGRGSALVAGVKGVFYIHIETLNTKPETRVTFISRENNAFRSNGIDTSVNGGHRFFPELQKVLSTYR